MTPEIRTIDPMPVLFVRRTGPYYQAAGEAFGVLCQFAGPRGLLGPASRMIGISHDDPHVTDESKFRYDACVTIDREVKPEGEVGQKTIAGGKYAVFLHAGAYEGFQQTYDQIFKAWLPGSGEKLREEPCFEVYLNSPDQAKPEDLRTEIWLPLQ
jgi:AraC family transcriptional regulator